jgi:hypothetical protein
MMAKDKRKRVSSGAKLVKLIDKIMFSPSSSTPQNVDSPKSLPHELPAPQPVESLFSKIKKMPTYLDVGKLGNTIKPLYGKFLSLIKTVLDSFSDFYIHKKIIFWGVLVIVLLVASIIVVGPGYGRSKQNSDVILEIPVSSNFLERFVLQDLQYKVDLEFARTLSRKGDLESLLEARRLISALKDVKPTLELNELENQVNNHISGIEFDKCISNARENLKLKNFLEAKENLLKAKQIRITSDLEQLERQIDIAYEKDQNQLRRLREEKEADIKNRQREDQAYTTATSKNTIEAYRKYLEEFPRGSHAREVTSKLNLLEKALIQKKLRVNLRFKYLKLNKDEVINFLRRHNLFDKKLNKDGTFKGYFELAKRDGVSVMIDHTTGLMWYDGNSEKERNLEDAEEWVNKLNHQRYGGYDDWRLPTLEEAASLLRKDKNNKGLHIAPTFSIKLSKIWTKDASMKRSLFGTPKNWIVCFDSGSIQAFYTGKKKKCNVLPVRSLEKETSSKE